MYNKFINFNLKLINFCVMDNNIIQIFISEKRY